MGFIWLIWLLLSKTSCVTSSFHTFLLPRPPGWDMKPFQTTAVFWGPWTNIHHAAKCIPCVLLRSKSCSLSLWLSTCIPYSPRSLALKDISFCCGFVSHCCVSQLRRCAGARCLSRSRRSVRSSPKSWWLFSLRLRWLRLPDCRACEPTAQQTAWTRSGWASQHQGAVSVSWCEGCDGLHCSKILWDWRHTTLVIAKQGFK